MDHEQWLQQHDRMMADHDRIMKEIDARLNRALRDSVREARNERTKRRELDEKITQLAAAQLMTEEKLQRLIDERRLGGNGNR
jgi:hypothetical protein